MRKLIMWNLITLDGNFVFSRTLTQAAVERNLARQRLELLDSRTLSTGGVILRHAPGANA